MAQFFRLHLCPPLKIDLEKRVHRHTMKRLDTLLLGGSPFQGVGATRSVGMVHCNQPSCFQDSARHYSVAWVVRRDISRFSVVAERRSDFDFFLTESTRVSDFEVHASRGWTTLAQDDCQPPGVEPRVPTRRCHQETAPNVKRKNSSKFVCILQ